MTDKWCFSKAIHLNLFIGSSWSKKDELWQDGVVSFWVRNDASTVVLTVLRVKVYDVPYKRGIFVLKIRQTYSITRSTGFIGSTNGTIITKILTSRSIYFVNTR